MDITETIPFESLPVFFQCVLYFCGVLLSLVMVGLCIIALIAVVTGIKTFIDEMKGDKKK